MMSQRTSLGWVPVGASGDPESDEGAGREKFMSVMLTYIQFNVTKLTIKTKH
jgi:hypothetical protein